VRMWLPTTSRTKMRMMRSISRFGRRNRMMRITNSLSPMITSLLVSLISVSLRGAARSFRRLRKGAKCSVIGTIGTTPDKISIHTSSL
jgi:hypothetical protein